MAMTFAVGPQIQEPSFRWDGSWRNSQGEQSAIRGTTIFWSTGDCEPINPLGPDSFAAGGGTYAAWLTSDGNTLHWSNGFTWYREGVLQQQIDQRSVVVPQQQSQQQQVMPPIRQMQGNMGNAIIGGVLGGNVGGGNNGFMDWGGGGTGMSCGGGYGMETMGMGGGVGLGNGMMIGSQSGMLMGGRGMTGGFSRCNCPRCMPRMMNYPQTAFMQPEGGYRSMML